MGLLRKKSAKQYFLRKNLLAVKAESIRISCCLNGLFSEGARYRRTTLRRSWAVNDDRCFHPTPISHLFQNISNRILF